MHYVTHFVRAGRSRGHHLSSTKATNHTVIIVMMTALCLGSAIGTARTQGGPSPSADEQNDDLRFRAPIGARQPRPRDLPESILRNEGHVTPAQRESDRRLQICRGC
jgi:hypothetical protein